MNKLVSAALAGTFVLTSVGLVSAAPGDGRSQFSRDRTQQGRMMRPEMGHMDLAAQRICGLDVGFHVNRMGERVAAWLNLNDAQKPLLRDLQDTAISAVNGAKSLCSEKPDNTTLTGRLAYAEKLATARLNVIKAIEPKLGAFYASLDDRQKASFDRIGTRMQQAGPDRPRIDRNDRRDDRGNDGRPMRRMGPGPHFRT